MATIGAQERRIHIPYLQRLLCADLPLFVLLWGFGIDPRRAYLWISEPAHARDTYVQYAPASVRAVHG